MVESFPLPSAQCWGSACTPAVHTVPLPVLFAAHLARLSAGSDMFFPLKLYADGGGSPNAGLQILNTQVPCCLN